MRQFRLRPRTKMKAAPSDAMRCQAGRLATYCSVSSSIVMTFHQPINEPPEAPQNSAFITSIEAQEGPRFEINIHPGEGGSRYACETIVAAWRPHGRAGSGTDTPRSRRGARRRRGSSPRTEPGQPHNSVDAGESFVR